MPKITKKNRAAVVLIILSLAIIGIFVFRHIYYKYFQLKVYLYNTYGSNIEITHQYEKRDGALFTSWLEKIYECYDKENDVEFEVCFADMENGSSELRYDTYKKVSETTKCREQMAAAVNRYTDEYITAANSGTITGNDIFVRIEKPENIKALSAELDAIVMDYDSKYSTYMSYNLIITKNKNLFEIFKQAEESGRIKVSVPYNGLSSPEDILPAITGCPAERITFAHNIDDSTLNEIFENNGDTNDEEYRDSSKYKYIVFCSNSEPNALLSKEFDIKVFGLR